MEAGKTSISNLGATAKTPFTGPRACTSIAEREAEPGDFFESCILDTPDTFSAAVACEAHRGARVGKKIGQFATAIAASLLLPMGVIAAMPMVGIGGFAAITLGGIATGLLAGSVEEDTLGIGRKMGGLLGRAAGALKGALCFALSPKDVSSGEKHTSEASKPHGEKADSAKGRPSGLKAQILENSRLAEDIALQWSDLPGAAVRLASAGLHTAATIIARPIVPVLIDAKAFANRLLFSSKAHIAIPFDKGRPMEASAERLLKSFVDLVSVEGASGNEGALAARLKEDLLALGFSEVKEDKAGNLIATVPGKVPDAPHVLLSAHMDTVERTSPSAVRIRHGEVYTDEKHILGADDRSGIAQILEGLRTAREAGVDHGRITVVFTRKEEIGLKGSLKLDRKELGEGPVLGFVFDSLALHNIHTKASGSPMINKSVGFRHDPRDPLVQLAAKALTDAGVNPRIVKASVFPGACSDANTEAFNSGNVKSLALGTGMWDVHSDFEHIRIKDLVDGAEVVAHLVSNAASLRVDDSGQIVPRRRVPGG